MAVTPSTASAHSPVTQGESSAPIRTCVGCRRREAAAELLRVVATLGATTQGEQSAQTWDAVPDPRHRAAGRGAWLHPVPACLELAERRRAFARALRVPGPVDATAVREYLQQRQDRLGDPTSGQPQE